MKVFKSILVLEGDGTYSVVFESLVRELVAVDFSKWSNASISSPNSVSSFVFHPVFLWFFLIARRIQLKIVHFVIQAPYSP